MQHISGTSSGVAYFVRNSFNEELVANACSAIQNSIQAEHTFHLSLSLTHPKNPSSSERKPNVPADYNLPKFQNSDTQAINQLHATYYMLEYHEIIGP
jgi:protoporphyrinogen oxidase